MPVDAVNGSYAAAQTNNNQPATAPDTSATQPPSSAPNGSEPSQSPSQTQQVQVYFYDANLGRAVNILV